MKNYEMYEEIKAQATGGTSQWHRSFFPRLVYTDGVAEFAKRMEAYWTIDVVGSYLPEVAKNARKYNNYFFICKFVVKNTKAVFTINSGIEGDKDVAKQRIPFTDLPDKNGEEAEYKFYLGLADERTWSLCLPSEY